MSDSKLDLSSSINFDTLLRETADKIKPLLTTDATTGMVSGPKTFFVDNLPASVPVETYIEAMAYRDLIVNSANLAFSEVSVELMAGNPDLKRTEFQMATVGRSNMEGAIQREYMRPDKEAGQLPGWGKLMTVAYNDYSSRGQGEFKNIKKHLGEIAARHLSD